MICRKADTKVFAAPRNLVASFFLILSFISFLLPPLAEAADSAVILMYHHVDTSTPASTSVAPGRFAEQLEYLDNGNFNVLPLLEVLQTIAAGRELPDNTVVITFDDGYVSVLSQALPLLRQRDWPFTVFVSTDYVDGRYSNYLNWDKLRELAASGATVGNHTRSHPHLVRRNENEGEADWRQRVHAEISDAQERIDRELGDAAIPVLAYPYGEYDGAIMQLTEELGLFALGQHSGAIGRDSNLYAAPRFPIATGFDELEDFILRVRSRPLPVQLADNEQHILQPGTLRPTLRLQLLQGDYRADSLACYASNQGEMELNSTGGEFGIVTARPRHDLSAGRTKYNCTAPSASQSGVYYWYSYPWMMKNADGSWYTE
jgi:poly-beta-1,6-N-acetyl-D-glucosamine N-deacetylase